MFHMFHSQPHYTGYDCTQDTIYSNLRIVYYLFLAPGNAAIHIRHTMD